MEEFTRLKLFRTYIIVLGFLFSFEAGFSQYSEEYKKYSSEYPNIHRVRLNQETTITIGFTKGVFDIKQEFIEEDLYLNDAANYNSKRNLNFSSFFELDKIEAASFTYIDEGYKKEEVQNFIEKDELNDSFYDDNKSLNFIYPNLKKGSKSKLQYSHKVKNPRFISPFYFGDYFPIINNKITIITDKNIALKFKEFNTENSNIKFTKEEKRKKIIYKWELKNKDEYEFESNSPSYKTVLPHIVPIITSYKEKGETKKLLGDVSDLYKWYYSLVEPVNVEPPNEELVSLVKEITANKKSDLEKVKAIYYWTQKNIKYIAFEYALGGFIPREANEVFRKKYGDCKDNSSILFRMLDIAGLKGSLTWIGTREIPYGYEEVPTPIVDNHMILSYEENGETYFLDATGRYTNINYPTSFIQGKEALVSNGNQFEIKKVPVIPAKRNSIIDQTKIEIKDGNVIGSSKTKVSGYPKIDYFHELEDENTQSKLKEYYNRKLIKGNNTFLIDNLKETNKFDYDKDLIIDYEFKINNYSKKLGDEIYINLNLNKVLSWFKTRKDRKNAIEFDYKRHYNYQTTFAIPDGYKVDYLPENIAVSNEFMECEITYVMNGNQVIYQQNIELNYLTLDLDEQKKVNDLIKKIEKNYKEIIVLKLK